MSRPSDEEARRRGILQAAFRLIAERGYHAVRVADIAAAAGVSSGTVHYYFSGKDDVLTQALHFSVGQAQARHQAALAHIVDARERLERLVELQLPASPEVRREWSVWLQFWDEATRRPQLQPIQAEMYANWRATVAAIVRRGQHQGTFRPGALDAEIDQFCSLQDGLAIQVLADSSRITIERMRELSIDFARRVLFAGPAAEPVPPTEGPLAAVG